MAKIGTYTQVSVPAGNDIVPMVDVSDTTDDATGSSRYLELSRLFGEMGPDACEGRLTLESGVPVSAADQIAATTLYWTPIGMGCVKTFDGTRWRLRRFGELSYTPGATMVSGKNYDAYINDGTGALSLGNAWTNDTTRADALVKQNGVWVGTGAPDYRYVGTVRATSTSTFEDSGGLAGTTQVGGKRFLWNAYHRVPRPVAVIDTTDSWAYTSATLRQANAAAGNQVAYVCGLASGELVSVDVAANGLKTNVGAMGSGASVGVGVDSTTVNSAAVTIAFYMDTTISAIGPARAQYRGSALLGYHTLVWLEDGATNFAWMGDNGATQFQSGMQGAVNA